MLSVVLRQRIVKRRTWKSCVMGIESGSFKGDTVEIIRARCEWGWVCKKWCASLQDNIRCKIEILFTHWPNMEAACFYSLRVHLRYGLNCLLKCHWIVKPMMALFEKEPTPAAFSLLYLNLPCETSDYVKVSYIIRLSKKGRTGKRLLCNRSGIDRARVCKRRTKKSRVKIKIQLQKNCIGD